MLARLAEGIKLEELESRARFNNGGMDDDDEGWTDEVELLSEEEKEELDGEHFACETRYREGP